MVRFEHNHCQSVIYPQVYSLTESNHVSLNHLLPFSSHELSSGHVLTFPDVAVLFKEPDGCERAQWSS